MAKFSRTQQNYSSDAKFRVGGDVAALEQLRCPSCNGGNPTVAQNCMWCGRSLRNNGTPTTHLGKYSTSNAGQQVQPYQSGTTNVSTNSSAQTQVMPAQSQYPANQPAYPQYSPPTVVIHHTQTVVVARQKSVGLAVFLAFLFGPLGMLYSTVLGGTLIFFLNVFLLFTTFGSGWLFTWIVGMVWASMAASSHNSRAITTYQHSTTYPPTYYQQP